VQAENDKGGQPVTSDLDTLKGGTASLVTRPVKLLGERKDDTKYAADDLN